MPDQEELLARIETLRGRLNKAQSARVANLGEKLKSLREKRVLTDPMAFVSDKRMLLDFMSKNLASALHRRVGGEKQRFASLCASLDAMSPLKVLARGYAVARKGSGSVIRSAAEVSVGERIGVLLGEGSLVCTVNEIEMGGNENG